MAAKKALGGRPPHTPTKKTRALAQRLAEEGASLESMAQALGISTPTLRKHYDVAVKAVHERTPDTERKVRQMVLGGYTQDQIAMALGVCPKLLRQRYADLIDELIPQIIGGIGGTLMQQAQRGNVAACIFILKTRGGPEWHPPKEHRVGGDPNNDTPVPVQVVRRVIVDPAAQDGDDD